MISSLDNSLAALYALHGSSSIIESLDQVHDHLNSTLQLLLSEISDVTDIQLNLESDSPFAEAPFLHIVSLMGRQSALVSSIHTYDL